MAKHYVGGARDQLFLLPVSMRDWLDEGHVAWFLLDVVAAIDTSKFRARYRNDGPGRPAYDPDMMLALLLYAYSMGVRSSRQIEALCRTDAAFKVICGGVVPDHATVARFLVDHERAIEDSFVAVLRLCAAAGLVSVGVLAVDGTKMAADASLKANRSRSAVEAELAALQAEAAAAVAAARAVDAAEDAGCDLFATGRLPVELATRAGRQASLEAALAEIAAQDAAEASDTAGWVAEADRAAAEGRPLPAFEPKTAAQRLAEAEVKAKAAHAGVDAAIAERAAKRAAKAAKAGRRRKGGATPKDQPWRRERQKLQRVDEQLEAARADAAHAAPVERRVNVTDPDSRIMKTAQGWLQGYNAQAVVDANQIVVACVVTQDTNDLRQYQPMVAAAQTNLAAAAVADPVGVVLADAGYWSHTNATIDGPDRLIATLKDRHQRAAAQQLGATSGPPPQDATITQAMEHRLRTPQGAHTYSQRGQLIEAVFGDTKTNRGWRSFRRRGLTAAASEWALINTSHNLAKLFRHNQMAVATPAPT